MVLYATVPPVSMVIAVRRTGMTVLLIHVENMDFNVM